jgi:multicomponent Na+:H+ antiporter subunit E
MPNARARSPLLGGRSAALAARLGLLSVLWVSLVDAHPVGLAVGLLALPLAAWGSLVLEPPGRVRVQPLELLRFLPLCARWALEGGLDVARRVLHPRAELTPGWLETRSRLPGGPVRFFLNSVVSLMPGTLAVEAEGNTLTLHLLDASPESRAATLARVRDLEARVARVFGLPPPPRGLP